MEELRGKANTWDVERQRLETKNAELQRSLLLWAGQKEELVQWGQRGRRELETRWAVRRRCGPCGVCLCHRRAVTSLLGASLSSSASGMASLAVSSQSAGGA